MSWTPDPRTAGFTRGTPFRPVAPNVATHNAQAQRADPGSILNFYRAMLALRNTRASIARGSFEQSFADGTVLGFQRVLGRERTLVLINFGTEARRVQVPGLRAGAGLRRLHGPRGTTQVLPPLSVRVYDVR
jgi:alpha-amylase